METPRHSQPPQRFGTVYGILLNTRAEVDGLGDALSAPPYGSPPKAPVLYLKTPNTWADDGARVAVPEDATVLVASAALGLVIGRTATRLSEADALDSVRGVVLAVDLAVPHATFYRPSVRHRCRDGFLPISDETATEGVDLDRGHVRLSVNGETASVLDLGALVRPVRRLLRDVTDFMTLAADDVLLVGLSPDLVRVGPGDRLSADLAGAGRLNCSLHAEAHAEAMA